jgi:hypothetical protein
MSFKWNPKAEQEIKKMALRNVKAQTRPAVERTVCPDHGKSPRLARHGEGLRIGDFCCRKVAEMAMKNAGLGDITWHEEA